MEQEKRIKPCPFCGNRDFGGVKCSKGRYGHFVIVKCNVCGAQSGGAKVAKCEHEYDKCPAWCEHALQAERVAIAKWNQRANP